MCVAIAMEPNTELTLDEVFKMGRSNSDGIGVAWAEDGQVHWYKSINYTPQSAQKFIADRAGFFRLVHFRLSTVGGVRVELCHPFEVGPLASPEQKGHSSRVLIHNGHWYRWKDILEILEKEQALPDKGPWSDSRLAAYLAHFDDDWLDVVTGKVATLNGAGDIKLLGSWESLRPGIKVSNKIWDHSFNYKRSGRDRDWPGWGRTAEEWEEKEKHEKALAEEAAAAEKKAKDEQEKQKKESAEGGEAAGGGSQGQVGSAGGTGGWKGYEAQPKFSPYTHGGGGPRIEVRPGEIRVGGGSGDTGNRILATGQGEAAGGGGGLGGTGDAGSSRHGVGITKSYVYVGNGVGRGQTSPLYIYQDGKEIIETSGRFIANGQVKVENQGGELRYDHTPWKNPTTGKWYWIPPESINGTKYRIEQIDERNARAILESVAAPIHEQHGE